ncbi:MAG: fructose-bisphosphate aldolase class II [Flavobacteriaceae bacterium]|jgi:fructose-bisphosphate aldolase class II
MKNLREYIEQAEKEKRAIAHLNISTIDMLYGCVDALSELRTSSGLDIPLIIGVSEGERKHMGLRVIRSIIDTIKEERNIPLFLNADHTGTVQGCKDAIDAGFDMVIYDNVKASFEDNVAGAREVVAYVKETKKDCVIEAELGFIGSGSVMKDTMPEGVSSENMTHPDEAQKYVEESGVDMLAPSVGTVHGIVKTGNPSLDAERVLQIRNTCGAPLVLHGGSGSTDEDFLAVIEAGISVIHISTEIRKAYFDALKENVNTTESISPYRYLAPVRLAVTQKAKERIALFWKM